VEDLQVFEERGGQLDSGAPLLSVEQFGLQPAPERLDDCVVVAVAGWFPWKAPSGPGERAR
jgi:hypothetical protein